ncbi:hypothetical protein C8J57DRAFT_1238165 [Mycena rebaudengoi]|nr:hypothetical protein C8J57DRAFT_1238165 [Mycena rebaudengoi]
MSVYTSEFPFTVAFPPRSVLADWLAAKASSMCTFSLSRFHHFFNLCECDIATETEKYAHLIYVLNGDIEKQSAHKERHMPSRNLVLNFRPLECGADVQRGDGHNAYRALVWFIFERMALTQPQRSRRAKPSSTLVERVRSTLADGTGWLKVAGVEVGLGVMNGAAKL